MVKILVIDDEPIYHKLTQRALALPDYEFVFANNGLEGIQAAQTTQPDVIITDLKMPDIDGYEVVSTLRRDTNFAHIPIMILTANTELEDKLNAFEKGADDYISKPFNPEELQARVRVLVQRGDVAKTARTLISSTEEIENYTIAVHSLRGGIGSSSIAMNLALGLNALWERPTLLVDGVLNSGQIALFLNTSSKRTWADIHIPKDEAPDEIVLQSIINKHETGLHYIASPAFPADAEIVTPHAVQSVLSWATGQYDYTIIDAAHSFDPITLAMLDIADSILLVLSPEMAAIRAAAAALNTYKQLGYPSEKIRLVLNWTFKRRGLAHKQIEKALKRKISLIIPHAPDIFIGAINMGRPIATHQTEHPIGILFENTAYQLSKETHKNLPPLQPSDTWKRVSQRIESIHNKG